MTTSATPLISSACTALSSSAIMFGSVRRLVIRLKAPEVTSLEGIEPIAKSPASRFELTLGAQCPTSSCPCETTVLLLASPGTPLQLATTDPIARSILARPRSWCPERVEGGNYRPTSPSEGMLSVSAGYTLLVKQQQLPEQVVVLQRYVFSW